MGWVGWLAGWLAISPLPFFSFLLLLCIRQVSLRLKKTRKNRICIGLISPRSFEYVRTYVVLPHATSEGRAGTKAARSREDFGLKYKAVSSTATIHSFIHSSEHWMVLRVTLSY